MSSLVRIKFTKGHEVRFISHLDLAKSVERAVRRGRLPVAYSQGFHPKPKIAFASALSVGVTSSGEYADLQFAKDISAVKVKKILNDTLPEGLNVLAAQAIPLNSPPLMSVINAANYTLNFCNVTSSQLQYAIKNLLASSQLEVQRSTKKGVRIIDIRPLIYSLSNDQNEVNKLTLLCASGSAQNLRPAEVLSLLGFSVDNVTIHREDLLVKDENKYFSPFEIVKEYNNDS